MKTLEKLVGWILIFLVAAETAFGTFFTQHKLSLIAFSSVGYFVCGLLIGVMPMFHYLSARANTNGWLKAAKRTLIIATFFYASFYALKHIYWVFEILPIDYRNADMIPQIIVSCKRWISGTWVYQPIPEIWNGLMPSYLPLMWMPYAPLMQLGVDVRWTSVIFFLAGIGLIMWMLARFSQVNFVQLILILLLISYLIFIQTDYNRIFFAWTEEGLVVFYYVLLGYGLSRNSLVIISLGIICCLLSRYSLFFWIPAFFAFQFFTGEKKKSLIETGIVFIAVLVIFLVPFFLKDPMYFLTLPEKYGSHSTGTWVNQPTLIFQGLGLAKFFSISQVSLLHKLDLFLAVIIPFSFYAVTFTLRKKSFINLSFAGMCGLKLTLVFFYNFIEVPYYYLFIVNTLFSYVILLHFLNPKSQTMNQQKT